MQLVSFLGKPWPWPLLCMSPLHWKIIWPVSDQFDNISFSWDNHLTIIWPPLIVSLSTLKIYLTPIWPLIQLVSFLGKPSNHYLTHLYASTLSTLFQEPANPQPTHFINSTSLPLKGKPVGPKPTQIYVSALFTLLGKTSQPTANPLRQFLSLKGKPANPQPTHLVKLTSPPLKEKAAGP